MSISSKDRKMLWGRAASKCSICRRDLVIEPKKDDHVVVGEECHIIASSNNGPRGGEDWPKDLDHYTNLILLCSEHHKIIDDKPDLFSSEKLRSLKSDHEKWVGLMLQLKIDDEEGQPVFAFRVRSGAELTELIANTDAYSFTNDQPETKKEAELIGGFLGLVHDLGEIWSDIDVSYRVESQFELNTQILLFYIHMFLYNYI